MTIKGIIDNTTPIKIKLITYGADRNKAVIHHESVFHVVDNFYVFRTKADDYGQYDNRLVAVYCGEFGIEFGSVSRFNEQLELIVFHPTWEDPGESLDVVSYVRKLGGNYTSTEVFIDNVKERMASNGHIRNTETRLLDELYQHGGSVDKEFVKAVISYKKEWEARKEEERRLKQEQFEREWEERKRREEEYHRIRIQSTKQELLAGGERLKLDPEIIFEISDEVGVKLPIKLKGWMNSSLTALRVQDGNVTGYYHMGNQSKTICIYMQKILDELKAEVK